MSVSVIYLSIYLSIKFKSVRLVVAHCKRDRVLSYSSGVLRAALTRRGILSFRNPPMCRVLNKVLCLMGNRKMRAANRKYCPANLPAHQGFSAVAGTARGWADGLYRRDGRGGRDTERNYERSKRENRLLCLGHRTTPESGL